MPAEMPGTTINSLKQVAADTAEVIAQMVKGGCDFKTALSMMVARSPNMRGWVKDETIALAKQSLINQKIEFHDPVRNPGISETKQVKEAFDYESVENGDLVAFGIQDKFYVLDVDFAPTYMWCTTNRGDRNNPEAQGFAVYRNFAREILEKGSEPRDLEGY